MHSRAGVFIRTKINSHSPNTVALWLGVMVFNLIVIATLWNVVVPAFGRLERERAEEEMAQVGRGIEQQLKEIHANTLYMGTWDGAYRFMGRLDPEPVRANFIRENFVPETQYPTGLTYLGFFDPSIRPVYAAQLTPTALRPLPAAVEAAFEEFIRAEQPRGLIRLGDQILLVTCAPILRSDGSGPSRGHYITAYKLTLENLSIQSTATTKARIGLSAPEYDQLDPKPHMHLDDQQTKSLHIPLVGLGGVFLGQIVLEQGRSIYRLGQDVFWRGVQAAWVISALSLLLGTLFFGRLDRARLERQALERRYRALVAQATEGIALVDSRSFVILEANASLALLLGHDHGTLVGKSVLNFAPYESSWTVRRLGAVTRGRPMSGEYRLRRRDGSFVEVEGSVSAVVDGEQEFLLIVFHSIEARREAERALKSHQETLQKITDSMLDCVMQADLEGRITFITPSIHSLLGYTPEHMVGRYLLDFIDPKHQPRVEEYLEVGAAVALEPTSYVVRVRHADGRLVYLESLGGTVCQDEVPFAFQFGYRDVTARVAAERAAREHQTLLQQVTDGMLDLVFLLDDRGLIRYTTPSLQTVLGYDPQDALGDHILAQVHPDDHPAMLGHLERGTQSPEPTRVEVRVRHAAGHYVWLETVGNPLFEGGRLVGGVLGCRDVTQRVQAEQAVRANEARLRQITDGMLDVVMLCDLEGRIEYVTPSSAQLFGYTPDELLGRHGLELVHPDYQGLAAESMAKSLYGPGSTRVELLDVHKDGRSIWVEVVGSLLYEGGRPHKVLVGVRDVTQRKIYESQITHLALHDALTGLGNRRMLQDRADHTLALARRKDWPAALLFLDLNRFKTINDTLGHDAGDELLIQVAWLLKQLVREEDTLVRYSGDEFVLLMQEASREQAGRTAEQLLQALGTSLELRGHRVQIGASVGVALYPEHGEDLTTLLKAADIAMYQAKRSGKHMVVYDPQHNPYTEERLQLEAQLRQAVRASDFEFFYQPIQSLHSGQVVGAEALARWHHQGDWISPGLFIPLAEDLGLIERIDALGLQRGLAELQGWHRQGVPLDLSVNCSAQTLQDPALPHYIASMLEGHGVPARHLTVEITETVLMHNLEQTKETLKRLRQIGVRIAVDDFGSGYASLGYLRHLPIDRLKLDRSLIGQIGNGADGETMLKAILRLGQNLDLEVLAEGVETPQQVAWLRQHGCDLVQGYLFGKPAPAQELARQLEQHQLSAPAN